MKGRKVIPFSTFSLFLPFRAAEENIWRMERKKKRNILYFEIQAGTEGEKKEERRRSLYHSHHLYCYAESL